MLKILNPHPSRQVTEEQKSGSCLHQTDGTSNDSNHKDDNNYYYLDLQFIQHTPHSFSL